MPSGAKSVLQSSCVKIYLCSNPEDSVLERRVLRESAFPKLREHCRHTLGLDVRVIDPFESSDPSRWPDENTRQRLINECRESSAGPFLLALVGHQYGAARPPTRVEVSEYQLLLHEGQKAGISTQEVERMYQRDENSIPTTYCRTSRHTSGFQLEGEEEVKMKAKEDELAKVFQTTASLCVNKGLMTAEGAMPYYRSAMDADLRFALEHRLESDIIQRCLVYIHKVINAKGQRPKTTKNSEPMAPLEDLSAGPSKEPLLSQLCEDFLPSLIHTSQILVYSTTTECDRRHGYTTARRKGYAESLCQQVHKDLVGLMKRANISETRDDVRVCDALAREGAEQEDACVILSRFYDVVRPEEEKVRDYVEQTEHHLPLVVTGGPCTGKAVLLARCAQQIEAWLPDRDPVVLPYFCHLSTSLSPKQLLSSLCYEIPRRYHHKAESRDEDATFGFTSNPDLRWEFSSTEAISDCQKHTNAILFAIAELRKQFSSLLSLMPSTKRPLILILDGLDHMEKRFGLEIIQSLPSPLPPNVKVILSASPSSRQILKALGPQRPQDCLLEAATKAPWYVPVPLAMVDRKRCVQMLALLLSRCGRKVTSGQQALVNQRLASCSLTLYVRLLHVHVALWHSDSDVTESSLPSGVHSSIAALLDHLEQKHGSAMVSRAVSYLTLSRTGLAEAELADLLASDDKAPWRGEKVPQIAVETLLLDLRRFLIRRTVAGLWVLSWVSRHFKLVITKRYLFTLEARKEIHSALADYFSRGGGFGNARPLPKSFHADRQPSSQPSDVPSSSREPTWVNMRRVLELPHHLQESEKWEQMEGEVLMSFRFHQAMIEAGLLGDLVAMLESEEALSRSRLFRERAFIASILKASACFLQRSPLQLPTVMETNLLPYREVFPPLNVYLSEIQLQRRDRESMVGVALCPAPSSIPSVRCLKLSAGDGHRSVADVAVTDCGIVAQIMDDGTAWFWMGPGDEAAKLSLTSEQQAFGFTGVKTSAQFILLSTWCDELVFWNVRKPEKFVPLQVRLNSNQQAPAQIGGFVACQQKLFTWWENQNSVDMFDIAHEIAKHFQCQSCVTCCVCSPDGARLCCGQEDGVVSLFDTDTGSVLATWSNASCEAILWMHFSHEKREIACGDTTGNVALWELAAQTHPPRLIREGSCGVEFGEVLSTDYSEDTHTWLACQSRRVSLWDTCNWELQDQFSAPQEELFTRALLSQTGHLLLASLEACSFILAWRVSTGACVFSLKTSQPPRALLKTASDLMCLDLGGLLTVWDAACLDAAGAAPKMRCGVRAVAADARGEHFYTADGSEAVWGWRFVSGLPHAHILHGRPVEKLCLSPDGLHLVTLSAGEVYVWNTETGRNLVRVAGSRATDILVTPNGNFGVSISEQHLSQVWKLTQGSVVCRIHLHLTDAQVSPESTFLIGRHRGDLLAASLWSGSISKRFSCVASCELVAAFCTLAEHPDFVMVMCASGTLYTWNVAAETACRHFQLPYAFRCSLRDFQMSSDGSYSLLSIKNEAIAILDLSQVKICSLKTEGPVVKACLDKTGCYLTYISTPPVRENPRICSLHTKPLLTVVRLVGGKRMGSVRLPQEPLTLQVCEPHCVFVGFGDGSVGVYWISEANVSGEVSVATEGRAGWLQKGPLDRWFPLSAPNVTWL